MKHVVLVISAALALTADAVGAQTPAAGSDPGNLERFSRGIKARYDKGILTVVVPVMEAKTTEKHVEIQSAG